MKKTIIYGGAFNPPTLAHQTIVQACVDYAEPRGADVWLLPSASRKDKNIPVPKEYRLELIQALLDDVQVRTVSVAVHTLELDHPEPTETFRTVRTLERFYPDRQFVWVFGSDSLASMSTWRHGDWLLKHLPILTVQRDTLPYPLPGNSQPLGVATSRLSSTEVRRRLTTGEAYDDLVGRSVGALLAKNKYAYRK